MSSFFKTITKLSNRNCGKLGDVFPYHNDYHYFGRIVCIQYYHWKPNQMNNTNKNTKIDNIFKQNFKNISTNSKKKAMNLNDAWFLHKINQLYKKELNLDEQNTKICYDPLFQMYENVAKDEDIYPKDNHMSQDFSENFSENQKYSIEPYVVEDSLFGMASIQTAVVSSRTQSHVWEEETIQKTQSDDKTKKHDNTENDDNNMNYQHETFDDVYVGDVEHKIPKTSESASVNQSDNKSEQRQSHSTSETNKNDKNNSNSEASEGDEHKQKEVVDDNKKHETDHHHVQKQKKKIIATNADLDLSSSSFEENMKKYEEEMSTSSVQNPTIKKGSFINKNRSQKQNDDEFNEINTENDNDHSAHSKF